MGNLVPLAKPHMCTHIDKTPIYSRKLWVFKQLSPAGRSRTPRLWDGCFVEWKVLAAVAKLGADLSQNHPPTPIKTTFGIPTFAYSEPLQVSMPSAEFKSPSEIRIDELISYL